MKQNCNGTIVPLQKNGIEKLLKKKKKPIITLHSISYFFTVQKSSNLFLYKIL